jgi:PAT family beta-lactamase induction signal transducer AmpG
MSDTVSENPEAGRHPTPRSTVAPSPDATAPKPSWGETLRVYLEAPTLRMLLLGFSAGLPLLLVFGTLSFWLREAGI